MSNQQRNLRHNPLLIGTGVFTLLWVVARACVQSITIDEADTFLNNVWQEGPGYWKPTANNHVLNSMLMKLATQLFGYSAFTLRLPALIGAALYIAAAYYLVRTISDRRLLQWSLLTCLIGSPFIMDYLVAARGYSLASAFLLWMVVLAASHCSQPPEVRASTLLRTSALISICGGLSICANFSFAMAVALTGLALLLWICREERRADAKVFAAFSFPALLVVYFFVGYDLEHWPKGQFTWGAESLWRTVTSLVSASLFEPNSFLLHPQLQHQFVHFGRFLYPALLVSMLAQCIALGIARKIPALAIWCGGAMVTALAAHQFLFSAYGILLPLDRTAMWLAILFFVTAGAVAASPRVSVATRWSGKLLVFVLGSIAVYNIGCLRLNYFNEWKYDAATKQVYSVIARYNHRYSLHSVSANWRYVASLNTYNAMSGQETLDWIPVAPTEVNFYPAGYQAYVVYLPSDEEFCRKEGLQLVYHDSFSQVAIAIRPEVEAAK